MLIKTLFRHFLTAGNEHDLHSPFLFDFYNNIIKAGDLPKNVLKIESVRKLAKRNDLVIEITDFGAGSRWNSSNFRKISTIAKTSEKAPRWQAILFRLIRKYIRDANVIELGTSLGITTAYLASASQKNKIVTFEGCPEISRIARNHFETLQLRNISQIIGNIDLTLPEYLNKINKVDFVFFDANHRYEPTMRYFQLCLAKAHEESFFIFDDIYWSEEMRLAWEDIKQHEAVRQTLDFWQIGIVLFRKTQPKQHFRLKA